MRDMVILHFGERMSSSSSKGTVIAFARQILLFLLDPFLIAGKQRQLVLDHTVEIIAKNSYLISRVHLGDWPCCHHQRSNSDVTLTHVHLRSTLKRLVAGAAF